MELTQVRKFVLERFKEVVRQELFSLWEDAMSDGETPFEPFEQYWEPELKWLERADSVWTIFDLLEELGYGADAIYELFFERVLGDTP